jgi:hypothetical protein
MLTCNGANALSASILSSPSSCPGQMAIGSDSVPPCTTRWATTLTRSRARGFDLAPSLDIKCLDEEPSIRVITRSNTSSSAFGLSYFRFRDKRHGR